MHKKIEKEWTTEAGLPAVALRVSHDPLPPETEATWKELGVQQSWLCGYVGVSKRNPLFGIRASEPCEAIEPASMEDFGNRGVFSILEMHAGGLQAMRQPNVAFDVHGSVTYAGQRLWGDPDEWWWFGFDCNHCDDTPQRCTLDYVRQECEILAEQLAILEPESCE